MILGTIDSTTRIRRLVTGGVSRAVDQVLPPGVVVWLPRLLRAVGLPFSYLVPDERLLPAESLRCFYLDPAWGQAALDGALAAATPTPVERRALRLQYETIQAELVESAAYGRCGFLLRSRLVSRWPGLRVEPRPLVRQLLTPSILLVVFGSFPASFQLVEPGGEVTLAVQRSGSEQWAGLRGEGGREPVPLPQRPDAAAGVIDWSAAGSSAGLAAGLLRGLAVAEFAGTGGASVDRLFRPTARGGAR
jgi:hypothetical protein